MIRFENVTKHLGGKKVLNDVTYGIQPKETFVIVGPSGTGKSVSLKHMVRRLTPDSGKVFVGDQCVSEAEGDALQDIRSRFGVLFQGAALLKSLTIGDNVGLPLRQRKDMSDYEIDALVQQKLEMVELHDVFDKYPADLSGGMQKRAGLARAIIMDPEIILYDEPTSGLDPVTSRTIDTLIDSLRRDLGVTSVVVTHDLHSALAIGTRIAMLSQGKVVEIASPEAFVKSDKQQVKDFLEAQYITKRGVWERNE
jgi:phospholipid/cholesterol/gamma-HCH transport system ATP-binding protein